MAITTAVQDIVDTPEKMPTNDSPEPVLTHSRSNLSIGSSVLPGLPKLSLSAFSAASSQIIEDFIQLNNSAAAIEALKNLNCSIYHDTFVVKAIRSVLDKPEDVQAQVASFITVAFDSKLFTRPQITRALEKLIQIAESLHGDIELVEDKLFSFFGAFTDDHVVDDTFLLRLPEAMLRQLSNAITDNEPHLARNLDLLKQYKQRCADFMPEFFNCGEAAVVQQFFGDLEDKLFKSSPITDAIPTDNGEANFLIPPVQEDVFRHEFVRRLLVTVLGQPDAQKEIVSRCLSVLYGSGQYMLRPDDVQLGVLRLLATMQDLSLDCPKASEIMSKFIVRMTVDEILPPAFVFDFIRLQLGDSLAVETLQRSFKWMTDLARHHLLAERFTKVWTGTDEHQPEAERFKRKLKDIIVDYLDTADVDAALKAFNQLDMSPDQEVEAIRKIVVFALDRQEQDWNLAINFLEALVQTEEIDSEVIQKGIQEISHKISDIQLDCPNALELLEKFFIPQCVARNLLSVDFRLADTEI